MGDEKKKPEESTVFERKAENTVKDSRETTDRKRRKFKWYHIVAAAVVLSVILIFVIWHFLPSKVLNVAVLDKTVLSYAQDDRIVKHSVYRKHQGFYWILNQQKYISSEGSDYDYTRDYFGPKLDEEGNFDHVTELRSISDRPDLIYLADAYGMGNDTYGYFNGGTPEYAGISPDDMAVVTYAYENGAPIIAETTLFSSPLSDTVYSQLTSLLGVTPTRWLGRYVVDLQDYTDLPDWAPPMYEQQEGVEWRFTGPGILLVSTDGKIKVLEQNTDFNTKDLLRIYINDEYGSEFFWCSRCNFYNWFELVEANYGTETVATYEFDLNATGMEKFKDISKSPRFSAVTRRQEEGHAPVYFFAGDFNDYVSGARYGKFLFANELFKFLSYDRQGDITNFYWTFYNPLIRQILSETASTRYTVEDEPHEEVSRVNNGKFQVMEDGKWRTLNLKAVSVNADEPCKKTYPRDFTFYEQLVSSAAELGANCLVAKDLLPPEFYTAVNRHNKGSGNTPLYILQEIGVPDGLEAADYLTEGGLTQWKNAIVTTVGALHGQAEARSERLGEATYFTDVSAYVLGLTVCPSLDADTCARMRADSFVFEGGYARDSRGIAGFAARLYHEAQTASKEGYGYYMPVSVSAESDMLEGAGSRDKNAYSFAGLVGPECEPYYFNEVKFDAAAAADGTKSLYATSRALFEKLNGLYEPLLISGVSFSDVNAAYSQEAVTETAQGEQLIEVLSAAKDAGCLGATVSDLNDSWAKVSEGMRKFTAEGSEGMWHNTCDPAQMTGLMALDPVQPTEAGLVLTDDDLVEGVSLSANAGYLYLTLQLFEEPDYKETTMFVGLDTFQRNDGEYFYAKGFTPNSLSGMEYVIRFEGKQDAALYVTEAYDRSSGTAFTQESYTGNYHKVIDLVYGGFSTDDTQFYQTGSTVYVRLPWSLLNVADPSKLLVINDRVMRSDRAKTVTTNGVLTSVMIGRNKDGDLLYAFPLDKHDPGYKTFRWKKWEECRYSLRAKESFGILRDYYRKN